MTYEIVTLLKHKNNPVKKICPLCEVENKPDNISCYLCQTDLTSVPLLKHTETPITSIPKKSIKTNFKNETIFKDYDDDKNDYTEENQNNLFMWIIFVIVFTFLILMILSGNSRL